MPERRVDEFAFVLMAGIILIFLLMVFWTTPPEPIPFVEPTSVLIKVSAGKVKSFYLTIKGPATSVTLSTKGEIKNWLEFDKNYFNVIEETKVKVNVKIPAKTKEKTYTGTIVVKSAGGKVEIPVEIQVVEVEIVEELFSKTFLLGDFIIEKGIFEETVISKENFEVFKGYFSKQSEEIIVEIPAERIDKISKGKLKIEIESTNNLGKLIILFNDEKIFDSRVGVGEVEIEVGREKINETNTISILAGTPGFRFWAVNIYRIKEIKFEVTYEGVYEKEFYFELSSEVIENFVKLGISFRRIDEEPLPELIIEVNDQIIYFKKPPKIWFDESFSEDILGNVILLGTENALVFKLEEEGRLEVENARLVVYYA